MLLLDLLYPSLAAKGKGGKGIQDLCSLGFAISEDFLTLYFYFFFYIGNFLNYSNFRL